MGKRGAGGFHRSSLLLRFKEGGEVDFGEVEGGRICRLRVLVFQRDLLDFLERNKDLFGGVAVLDLEMEVSGRDAADALAGIFAARGFDDQDHVLIGIPADDTEEAGEFGFKEAAVEGELATLVNGGFRQRRLAVLGFRVGELQTGGMLHAGALHGIDIIRGGTSGNPRGGCGFGGLFRGHFDRRFSGLNLGGHAEEGDRREQAETGNGRQTADQQGWLSAEDGNLVGGIERGSVEEQHHKKAKAGGKESAEQGLGRGLVQAGRLLDIDFRLFDFLGLGDLDKRLDERLDFDVFGEVFEVVLGEAVPGNTLEVAFADFDLHALVIGGGQEDFTFDGFARGQLIRISLGETREQSANQ
jgi:hypothetical protein